MANCPRCDRAIDSQAIECPHCRYQLKAFGHPGIPLYRATESEYLCDRCVYHDDDTCNFPQRPHAKTCTLFRDSSLPLKEETTHPTANGFQSVKYWLGRHRGLVAIAVIALVSILLAF
ncbi:zinc ribbon domain-containing protein [Myxosarcina sp. GI1(2024)]